MPLCLRQVLYSEDGYTYLDVRPELEVQEVGKVKNSVNIPIMHATRKYDPEQKKKVVQKSPNEAFADVVKKRFPDPETKLLVGCSDGRKYSMDALMALDEAGYTHIAGLKVLSYHKQHSAKCNGGGVVVRHVSGRTSAKRDKCSSARDGSPEPAPTSYCRGLLAH